MGATERTEGRGWRRGLAALVAAGLLLTISACGSGTEPTTSNATRTTASTAFEFPTAAAQTRLDEFVQTASTPGAVLAVSVKGAPPTLLTSGVSDVRAGTPMTPDGVFAIASITKTFTAALVLRLVSEGKVDLDAPINTYGLDFPNGDRITVRQLLDHTSGIPPLGGENEAGVDPYAAEFQQKMLADLSHRYSPTEVLDLVGGRPLLFAPGTQMSYSNTNTILAGQIVERVTGRPLVDEYHQQLLDPLGLHATRYAAVEPFPVTVPGVFTLQPGGPLMHTTDFDGTSSLSAAGASGAMVSNATDLITWANALLRDGSVLGPEMSRQAHTIGPNGAGLGVFGFGPQGFCNGRPCPPSTTFTAFGHAGGIPGAASMLVYDSTTDSTVVLLTNRQPVDGLDQLVQDELNLIAAAQK